LPKSKVEIFLIDAQINGNLLYDRYLILIALLHLVQHFFHGLHLDHIVEDQPLLPLEDEHEAGLFLILERPQHAEALERFRVDLDGIQDLAETFGIAELDDAELHGVFAVGGDDCALVEFEVVIVDLLHDVIDEQVFLELFLQD
jgi:hypothetical protein